MNYRWISVLGYLLLVTALIGLIYGGSILARTPVTMAVQAGAVVLMIWARATFGLRSFHAAADPTSGGLVTRGPYRFLRHPIYASVLYFCTAAVLNHLSWINVLLLFLAALGAGIRIACEEHLLLKRYPEYAEYSLHTRRIIPFLL
jgi:protein-S-isoprenylcysteine O-methyltransferase Ste14